MSMLFVHEQAFKTHYNRQKTAGRNYCLQGTGLTDHQRVHIFECILFQYSVQSLAPITVLYLLASLALHLPLV